MQTVTALGTALLQWCFSSRNFGAFPTVSAGTGTGADVDNKLQVYFLEKKRKKQTPKPERNSHKQHKQHRPQYLQELWWRWTLDERVLETEWRSIRQLKQRQQQQHKRGQKQQEKQKANNWTWCKRFHLQKFPQPCRILHRHRARLKHFVGKIERWDHDPGTGDHQIPVSHKETNWCRVIDS